MTELLPLLREIAKYDLQLESVKNSKFWPQLPNQLSRKINEINPSLRALGICVNRSSTDNTNKEYIIKSKYKKDLPCIAGSLNSSPTSTEITKTDTQTKLDSDKLIIINNAVDAVDDFFQSTKQAPLYDKKIDELLGTYVAFDPEYDATADNRIDAVSFVDSNGKSEIKLRNRDFNGSEVALLDYINTTILNYRWSVGWNTQGNATDATNIKFCDLYILHKRCEANGFPSIVKIGNRGVPYLANSEYGHIDLMNVYRKAMVKDGIYHSAYRTNKLDHVSKALLGKGKYNNYSGLDFKSLPIEEQEKYSLQDSQLVMDLSKYNNYEALDAILAVAKITELDFERVCRTNLLTWWGAIFDKLIERGECQPLERKEFTGTYKGAEVLTPKKGKYNNVVVIDAKSLYPSVGINYKLSFDTINCSCCQNNPDARLCGIIPNEFTKDCTFVNPKTDWICKQREGAFPSKLKVFKAERLKLKDLGNKAKQHALKILINGGYGVFGNKEYSFYDPRVAELVTAAGRYILSEMQHTAKKDYNFEIIYGDTDSLFLHNTTEDSLKEFQQRFKEKYDIELEIKNRYDKLLLSAGKKHYIGVEKGVLDNVGFEGEKSDRCEFFHIVYSQLLDDILTKEIDPLLNVRKAFSDLDSDKVDSKLLIISLRVNQDHRDYVASARVGRIAKAVGANKGDLIEFYNANVKKTGKSWTLDPAQIDIAKYKELLWNTIKEILDIEGCSVTDLAKEFGIKIKGQGRKKSNKKKPIFEDYSIVLNKENGIGGEK